MFKTGPPVLSILSRSIGRRAEKNVYNTLNAAGHAASGLVLKP